MEYNLGNTLRTILLIVFCVVLFIVVLIAYLYYKMGNELTYERKGRLVGFMIIIASCLAVCVWSMISH